VKKRIITALTAAMLTAGALVGIAGPASAATHTGYVYGGEAGVSAKVVVSDVTSTMGGTRVYVDVYYSGTPDSGNWVEVDSRYGYYSGAWPNTLSYVSPTHQRTSYIIKGFEPVGTYDVEFMGIVSGDLLQKDRAVSFTVKRNTTISFNATPEPVKRYGYTYATGHVSKLVPYGYQSSHYVSATYGSVHIYFNPAGASPKRYITSTSVNSHGYYSKRVQVSGAGTWSAAYFPGGSTYANSVSTGDYVGLR